MRLFLAVAVLVLALVAYTEAQQEETLEQKFSAFATKVSEGMKTLSEKVQTGFEQIRNSETTKQSTDWLSTKFQELKDMIAQQQ